MVSLRTTPRSFEELVDADAARTDQQRRGNRRYAARTAPLLLLLLAALVTIAAYARPAAILAAPSSAPQPIRQLRPLSTTAAAAAAAAATNSPPRPSLRAGLIMLVVERFPPWWPWLVASYQRNAPRFELIAVHTGERPPPAATAADAHVRYVHLTIPQLETRLAEKLGVTAQQAAAKLASKKGLSDLKPYYGKAFESELAGYTHWGWVDWDLILGDIVDVVGEEAFWASDAVTFGGATLGFAWAGQLTVFKNTRESRELYGAVDDHLALGFKADGDGQSGWEERVFLRDTLRKFPRFSIHFHMGAQMDYKAQWLTWVPFDYYWHAGRVLRCAKKPLHVDGRPPLELSNVSAWHADIRMIQSDPQGFYNRKTRVCLRWDLTSSPWKCCPHSLGVSYVWEGGRLRGVESLYPTAAEGVGAQLAALAKAAGSRMRVRGGYDVCHEGAFFHAGLSPQGEAPKCGEGSWALLDDIGRFSGQLRVLREGACPSHVVK